MTPRTILVSVMAANNEIGTLQPLGRDRRDRRTSTARCFHTDAAQAAGKVPIDVERDEHRPAVADRRTSSTARRAAGALFVRQHEAEARARAADRRRRAGERHALRHAQRSRHRRPRPGGGDLPARDGRRRARGSAALRDRLLDGLRAQLDGVRVNGSLEHRLPHNLHVSFDGVEGEALLMALGDLAVSTGSACSSGSQAPSHVLQAIGAIGDRAGASIRFGLGRTTTAADIDFAIDRVVDRRRRRSAPEQLRLRSQQSRRLSLRLGGHHDIDYTMTTNHRRP